VSETRAATVHFGRLERRGLILGLSAAQTAALGVAVIVAVLAEYTAGASGILLAAPLWGIPAALALVHVAGRPALSWLPVVGHWGIRGGLMQTRHRVRVQDITPMELELPGVGRRLRVIEGPGSSAALIHDPRTSTIIAMLSVSGGRFVLADDGAQQRRVAGWGRLLASLCQQPSVVRLQVLERCLPGGGAPVRRWWADHALTDAPWAARVLADLVADAEQVSDRHECFLAIAIRTSRSGGRGTSPVSLAAVEQQLAAVAEGARAADLDVHGWVTRRRLTSVLRATYDPLGAARSGPGESQDGASTSLLAGPMAVDEDWESIRTDSAHHAVYWVQEWPRSEVHVGFLQPLLLAPGARRALSLIAEPLSPTKALRDIRRAKVEHAADAEQRARIGRLEDETTRAEATDLVRREQELVAGHGDLRFVGLLTVSAASPAELDAACAATESAAAQALCEIRRLVGQQGQAFAAGAVPLARGVS
jgi:hypothetical protein